MKNSKEYVREQYSKVVAQSSTSPACVCQEGFDEDYAHLPGYFPGANYGLGCGLPTEFAKIRPGQTVLDLGSGAGNDCFIARAEVGETGKVYGLDFSEAMVNKARENVAKLGFSNVEFVLGDIEQIPLNPQSVDVVLSNCVLNLVEDKVKAFSEIHSVLKTGGHMCISDVVTTSPLPHALGQNLDLLADCIGGALPKTDYLNTLQQAGFKHYEILKERTLNLPQNIAKEFALPADFQLLSITVYAKK